MLFAAVGGLEGGTSGGEVQNCAACQFCGQLSDRFVS